MRNTRLWVILYEPTWMSTDSVMITNSPPSRSSSNSVRVTMARPAMAPLQHHFELVGWAETTIVVRFWLIAGMFVALGLGIFYVGWFPK